MKASADIIRPTVTDSPKQQDGTIIFLLTRIAQGLIALILVGAPFPFGSVQDQWVFTIEIGLCLLMALWAGIQIAGGAVSFVAARFMWPLMALVLLFTLSLVPLPQNVLTLFSPEASRLYDAAAEVVSKIGAGAAPAFRITLTPFDTEGELLKFVTYLCFFLLALNLLRHFRGYLAVCQAVIATGAVVAVLGMVQNLWSNGMIYWRFDSGSGTPFGPFVNHNNFAGYIELCLGLSLGMLVAEIRRIRNIESTPGPAGYFVWMWRKRGARAWMYSVASIAMVAGLTVSLSRSGMVSILAASCIFGVVALRIPRKRTESEHSSEKSHRWAVWGSLAVALLLVISLVLSPRIRGRWSTIVDESARYRLGILRDGLKTIAAFPVIGSGLGSFHSVYPRYKGNTSPGDPIHAENEYLQWTMETGLTGFVLMGLVVWGFARHVLSRLGARGDPYYRSLGYGALFSLTAVCVHNLADFSTHVPSNALTMVAIAAFCLIAANSRGTPRAGERFLLNERRIPLRSWSAVRVIVAVLLLALLVGRQAWSHYQSQRLTTQWSLNKPFLVKQDPDESQFAQLSDAIRWSPWNDGPRSLRAMTCESAAASKNLFEFFDKRRLLELAEKDILAAVILRPTEAGYWTMLGRIEQGLSRADISRAAFLHAIELAPNNGSLQRDYGLFLLSRGEAQGAAVRFARARHLSSYLELRPMLEAISSVTGDQRMWRSIVQEEPQDLRVYADFLASRGQMVLSGQILREAEILEKRSRR